MPKLVRIEIGPKVQILSHQSKIATQIELFVGHGDSYEAAQFRRLGYLSLNSNERSKFQARELKSVYVNAPGQYLRMLVHKCHINEVNLFNQVCFQVTSYELNTEDSCRRNGLSLCHGGKITSTFDSSFDREAQDSARRVQHTWLLVPNTCRRYTPSGWHCRGQSPGRQAWETGARGPGGFPCTFRLRSSSPSRFLSGTQWAVKWSGEAYSPRVE